MQTVRSLRKIHEKGGGVEIGYVDQSGFQLI